MFFSIAHKFVVQLYILSYSDTEVPRRKVFFCISIQRVDINFEHSVISTKMYAAQVNSFTIFPDLTGINITNWNS